VKAEVIRPIAITELLLGLCVHGDDSFRNVAEKVPPLPRVSSAVNTPVSMGRVQ
jgi:hypothetical protein